MRLIRCQKMVLHLQYVQSQIPTPLQHTANFKQPACPMHNSNTESSSFPPRQTNTTPPSSCPVKTLSQSTDRTPTPQSTLSKLNPLNYMPTLSNTPSATQTYTLPISKETSSIPRGDADSNWEYPSPQQMYNAMLRKQQPGQGEIDITAVESMVAVHNFLNEGAWEEILTWEHLFSQGLVTGFSRCQGGEEGILNAKTRREFLKARREALGVKPSRADEEEAEASEPKLLRFQGRPNDPTPKSRILRSLAYVFPNSFDKNKPFDRHDWYVARKQSDGSVLEKRYVIDYYGGGLQATGEPVFFLDIRPAIDGPTGAAERMIRWGSDVWWRASGGSVREMERREKEVAAAAKLMNILLFNDHPPLLVVCVQPTRFTTCSTPSPRNGTRGAPSSCDCCPDENSCFSIAHSATGSAFRAAVVCIFSSYDPSAK
ncbi:hypothetical protein R6Q59_009852 [Mikania micrantha]